MSSTFGTTGSAAVSGNNQGGSALATAATSEINLLVSEVEQAYNDFTIERTLFGPADIIDRHLLAAIYLVRTDAALAASQHDAPGVSNRLQKIIAHLSISEEWMLHGDVTAATASAAQAANVQREVIIGEANARASASFAAVLAPASIGTIQSDPTRSLLTAQTSVFALGVDGRLPYELAGVSVTVGGRAAGLLSVSPSLITFYVPAEAAPGEAEVVVTSQDGYVSRGTTVVTSVAPGLFATSGDGAGAGTIMNAATFARGTFEVTTAAALTSDKRTRLMMFASGISTVAANTDAGNDVRTDGGTVANLAESIAVEARTRDGRVFRLPVEYAGAQGRLPGLDQINFVLVPELQGVGRVELTIIVGDERSNNVTVMIG